MMARRSHVDSEEVESEEENEDMRFYTETFEKLKCIGKELLFNGA